MISVTNASIPYLPDLIIVFCIPLGRNTEALRSYERAYGLQWDHVISVTNASISYLPDLIIVFCIPLGRNTEALRSYERAYGLQWDHVISVTNAARLLRSLGRNHQAEILYTR